VGGSSGKGTGCFRQYLTQPDWDIDFLIDGNGDIEIGRVGPIRCAATAANEDQQLAALVRRPNETFVQLLERLDGAIGKALEDAECRFRKF